MSDKQFYKDVQFIFEEYLSPKKDNLQLRVRDVSKGRIMPVESMNYSKVFFDCDLNIYKIDKEGKLIKVENDDFEAVVMRQE